MKKTFFICGATLLLVLTGCISVPVPKETSTNRHNSLITNGVSLDFPEDWVLVNNNSDETIFSTGYTGEVKLVLEHMKYDLSINELNASLFNNLFKDYRLSRISSKIFRDGDILYEIYPGKSKIDGSPIVVGCIIKKKIKTIDIISFHGMKTSSDNLLICLETLRSLHFVTPSMVKRITPQGVCFFSQDDTWSFSGEKDGGILVSTIWEDVPLTVWIGYILPSDKNLSTGVLSKTEFTINASPVKVTQILTSDGVNFYTQINNKDVLVSVSANGFLATEELKESTLFKRLLSEKILFMPEATENE